MPDRLTSISTKLPALFQYGQAKSIARRIQELSRFRDLRAVPVEVLAIAKRRAPAGGGEHAEAERRYRLAHRLEPRGIADQAARAQSGQAVGLGKRPADDDVRMPAELGQKRLAAEVEVRLVNHDGDVGRRASNDFAQSRRAE